MVSGWPKKVQGKYKPFLYHKNELAVEDNCLIEGNRVAIPFQFRQKLLTELYNNHTGLVRMEAPAQSYVWWPGM